VVRVLHIVDPEDAGRRLSDLGVSPRDAEPLLRDLRKYLLCIPDHGTPLGPLTGILSGKGIPVARGVRGICFSVSSDDQVEEWARGSRQAEDALADTRAAIRRYTTREFTLSCRGGSLSLSGRPRIMGVLNVTPDSFSDGGKFATRKQAVRRALEMVEEGADIIDVGGESTRPGSRGVSLAVERERVLPVLEELAGKTGVLLSVDTTKAQVAREAAAAGAHIVNDTSALSDDPEMGDVVRESGCAVVLMHRRGTPETMQNAPSYRSFFEEMLDELEERVDAATAAGIPRDRILVDPGVGFGKRLEDNLALHIRLPEMRNLGLPILFGPSRKSFLGALTGKSAEERVFGTAASVALAVAGGAHLIRVHDVRAMMDVVRVSAAIAGGNR
jgi:dihydropteroate synthase